MTLGIGSDSSSEIYYSADEEIVQSHTDLSSKAIDYRAKAVVLKKRIEAQNRKTVALESVGAITCLAAGPTAIGMILGEIGFRMVHSLVKEVKAIS
jgi:hypothetical protein